MSSKATKPRSKKRVKTYRAALKAAAGAHRCSQGFESIGFDGEHRLVNKVWMKKLESENQRHVKILTDKARSIIKSAIDEGKYKDREDELEPPFMKPSEHPLNYSWWCSFCRDFESTLVLCAGCRVGICVANEYSPTACLSWSPKINEPDFVFYCPYCVGPKVPCELDLTGNKPHKRDIFFRYDSPVLIVSITWHQTATPYAEILRTILHRKYSGNEDSIMLMDAALDIGADGPAVEVKSTIGDDTVVTATSVAAVDFLKEYPAAKIVIIVDTHCLDTGAFVWRGDSPVSYETCTLPEIVGDCIPKNIGQYFSDAKDAPTHCHKTLIVNLACGASVANPITRSKLLMGHCADAVLSFANVSTVVGEIASPLSEFIALWVQTPSSYDFIVATAFPTDWVQSHQPVLSRRETGHILYSLFSFGRPEGKVVLCHRKECRKEITFRPDAKRDVVSFTCKGCNSKCKTPKYYSNRETALGRKAIVKGHYPPEQFPTEWKLPAPTMTPSKSLPIMPLFSLPTASPSFSHSVPPSPPPPSSHEPSPVPSDLRKRTSVREADSGAKQKRKKRN